MAVYHRKNNPRVDHTKSSEKKKIESVLFLFKVLTGAESRYWPIELKMAALVWTVRRIVHMIKFSRNPTIIYTNHGANPTIAAETKLSTTNIDKLNMKLIRASIYLSQFRLDVRHRSGKFNIIADALNRLSSKTPAKNNSLDIDAENPETDQVYVYASTLVEISTEFRKVLKEKYAKNET